MNYFTNVDMKKKKFSKNYKLLLICPVKNLIAGNAPPTYERLKNLPEKGFTVMKLNNLILILELLKKTLISMNLKL